MSLPRGIRNHNPLNIRRSKDQWKGMAEVQNDRAFVQFKSLDGSRCSNGDSGEWNIVYRLVRYAEGMGTV